MTRSPLRRGPRVNPGYCEEKHIKKTDELDPRAFTFYRSLAPEPMRVRDFWRVTFGAENRRDLAYAVAWGLIAASMSAVSVYLMRSLIDWALPQGSRSSLALLASGWFVVALTASNLRLSRALLQTRIGTRVDVSAEAALVGRALSLPVSQFKGFGSGDLSERIRDGAEDWFPRYEAHHKQLLPDPNASDE